jgi:hypothetical protein
MGGWGASVRSFNTSQTSSYLQKHRHRIPDYWYFQTEQICSIGSGAVESSVKQIARRVKISGAQWIAKNVPQVIKHRTAYLNASLLN